MYSIFNDKTGHEFFKLDDLKEASRLFHTITPRKHSYIILFDEETGCIVKMKGKNEKPYYDKDYDLRRRKLSKT